MKNNKILQSWVALLLVPCLLFDPRLAVALQVPAPVSAVEYLNAAPFNTSALAEWLIPSRWTAGHGDPAPEETHLRAKFFRRISASDPTLSKDYLTKANAILRPFIGRDLSAEEFRKAAQAVQAWALPSLVYAAVLLYADNPSDQGVDWSFAYNNENQMTFYKAMRKTELGWFAVPMTFSKRNAKEEFFSVAQVQRVVRQPPRVLPGMYFHFGGKKILYQVAKADPDHDSYWVVEAASDGEPFPKDAKTFSESRIRRAWILNGLPEIRQPKAVVGAAGGLADTRGTLITGDTYIEGATKNLLGDTALDMSSDELRRGTLPGLPPQLGMTPPNDDTRQPPSTFPPKSGPKRRKMSLHDLAESEYSQRPMGPEEERIPETLAIKRKQLAKRVQLPTRTMKVLEELLIEDILNFALGLSLDSSQSLILSGFAHAALSSGVRAAATQTEQMAQKLLTDSKVRYPSVQANLFMRLVERYEALQAQMRRAWQHRMRIESLEKQLKRKAFDLGDRVVRLLVAIEKDREDLQNRSQSGSGGPSGNVRRFPLEGPEDLHGIGGTPHTVTAVLGSA